MLELVVEMKGKLGVERTVTVVDAVCPRSLTSFIHFEGAHWVIEHATCRYSPTILVPHFRGIALNVGITLQAPSYNVPAEASELYLAQQNPTFISRSHTG